MNKTPVLVTGATGFIGSAVLRALQGNPLAQVRALARRAPCDGPGSARTQFVRGDLTDPFSLLDACRGIHTVIQAASYVGPDPSRSRAVNTDGTAALVAAARRQGVARVIYVSTASVYGRGRHDGVPPPSTEYSPASAASRNRLAAEQFVRDSGGWVVRPHLVYGTGDRWFVPAFADLMTESGARPNNPARLSTVLVDDLAGVLSGLATLEEGRVPLGTAFDVNHPTPTSVTTMARTIASALALDIPDHALPFEEFRRRVRREGPTRRNLTVFEHDRWYDSGAVWDLVDHKPGDPFATGLARHAGWYRRFLRLRERTGPCGRSRVGDP